MKNVRGPRLEFVLLAMGVVVGAGFVILRRERAAEPEKPSAADSVVVDRPVPDSVKIAWRYPAGAAILSSPVVVSGRVYFGSHDNRLHCVLAADGEPVWTFETGDDVEAPPLVIDGRVYVGSADGKLYAVDAASGEGVWSYETDGRILGGASAWRRPDGGLNILVGSYDNRLHCVDGATGEGRWTVLTENYVNGTPAVFEELVVFGGCDGIVHVVDAAAGATLRDVPLGDSVYIASSVVVDGAVAYVAHVDNGCAAVAVRTGEVLWTHAAEDSFFTSPALDSARMVVGGRDKILRAIDRASGKARWTYPCRDVLDGSPAIADGRVLVGSADGRLHAVDVEKGNLIWEFSLGGPVSSTPAVAEGLIYVGCEDGFLYALGPKR